VTMTIEIKQLIIRAVVEARREPAGPGEHRSQAVPEPVHHTTHQSAHQTAHRSAPPDVAGDRETLIAECTRQVLRELQRGRGR
jgi:hypothetical protein